MGTQLKQPRVLFFANMHWIYSWLQFKKTMPNYFVQNAVLVNLSNSSHALDEINMQ